MSRKNRNPDFKRQEMRSASPVARSGADDFRISRNGWIVIVAGVCLAALGYVFLKRVDPAGRNVYAVLAPLSLLTGYLLIPAALYIRDTPKKSE